MNSASIILVDKTWIIKLLVSGMTSQEQQFVCFFWLWILLPKSLACSLKQLYFT